jgi:hypothetical protein
MVAHSRHSLLSLQTKRSWHKDEVLLLGALLSQMGPVHIIKPHLLRIILILSCHACLCTHRSLACCVAGGGQKPIWPTQPPHVSHTQHEPKQSSDICCVENLLHLTLPAYGWRCDHVGLDGQCRPIYIRYVVENGVQGQISSLPRQTPNITVEYLAIHCTLWDNLIAQL